MNGNLNGGETKSSNSIPIGTGNIGLVWILDGALTTKRLNPAIQAVFIYDKGPTCERRILRNSICSWVGLVKLRIESHETEMSL